MVRLRGYCKTPLKNAAQTRESPEKALVLLSPSPFSGDFSGKTPKQDDLFRWSPCSGRVRSIGRLCMTWIHVTLRSMRASLFGPPRRRPDDVFPTTLAVAVGTMDGLPNRRSVRATRAPQTRLQAKGNGLQASSVLSPSRDARSPVRSVLAPKSKVESVESFVVGPTVAEWSPRWVGTKMLQKRARPSPHVHPRNFT